MMIHVPLKKRFKFCGKIKKGQIQDGKEIEDNGKSIDNQYCFTPTSTEESSVTSPRTDSPLVSDGSAESPSTPKSYDSSEKWGNISQSFLAQSSPSSADESNTNATPPRPTAFKPYNGSKVAMERCLLEYRNPSVSEYSPHHLPVSLNPSSYFSHLPYYEGIQSLGLSSKTEKLLEGTSIGRTLPKFTNGQRKGEGNPESGNGFKCNFDISRELQRKESASDSTEPTLKRKSSEACVFKDDYYWDKRRRNNASAKRSRDARRARELETQINFAFLHEENRKLKAEIAVLREENADLRGMICASNRS